MPNSSTFRIKPIGEFVERWMLGEKWIDPFVRDSPFKARMWRSNDLDPQYKATRNLDALDFLGRFDSCSVDGVLFDPPYSPRQIAECYGGIGRKASQRDTQSRFWGDLKKEIARIVKPGGLALTFGWNSGGCGSANGFQLQEVLIVAHGGWHNDTICTAELRGPAVVGIPF